MYYVDVFKSNVIIDMTTGMEVRDSSIKSDGKRWNFGRLIDSYYVCMF